ncbi:hypothetical protein EXIGLDRAFT_724148, partial [Exidia glandulosa HHB12029]
MWEERASEYTHRNRYLGSKSQVSIQSRRAEGKEESEKIGKVWVIFKDIAEAELKSRCMHHSRRWARAPALK